MKKKYISFFLIVIIVVGISSYFIYELMKDKSTINKTEITMSILKYGYTLDDRDTLLMKEEFENLKSILEEPTIDYEKYASSLAKLYIIDLYTIDNKVNSYDVPCLEYIYPSTKENFTLNIIGTLYKSVIDNSDGKRNQELPVVKTIEIIDFKEATYTLNDQELISYELNINWTYEKDLGYNNKSKITIIKEDNKLYVVKQDIID